MRIQVRDAEDMNLLGLFLKAALEERPGALDRARIEGDFAVTASGMSVTLSFSPQGVVITKGVSAKPRAHIKGSLEALVDIAKGRLWQTVATGKARVSGNPIAALPLARVLRQPAGSSA